MILNSLEPPNLQRLVRLGQEHCRTPCRLTNSSGVKVAGICGQKVRDCKRHAPRRLGASNYQYGIGSYPPVLVSRGVTGHGLASGPYYIDDQVRAFQAEEASEMARHVQTISEDSADVEEMEELSRDVRVKFASRTPTLAKNRTRGESDSYDLRKSLAASSGAGPSRKKSAPPAPSLWFGMIGKKGMRWITSNPSEAHDTMSKKHCRIGEVFQTQAEAEAWIEGEEEIPDLVPRYDSDSDDDSSVAEIDE
jgi:hypothetical protein